VLLSFPQLARIKVETYGVDLPVKTKYAANIKRRLYIYGQNILIPMTKKTRKATFLTFGIYAMRSE
jgi:hypothetical protein